MLKVDSYLVNNMLVNTGRLTFVSSSAIADIHHHDCFQWCLAINQPFDAIVAEEKLAQTWGYLVNQGVGHNCYAPDSAAVVQFVAADSFWGRAFKQFLGDKPYVKMEDIISAEYLGHIISLNHSEETDEVLMDQIENFLNTYFPVEFIPARPEIDERIAKMYLYIQNHLHEKIAIKDLSKEVWLSPDRARHFFFEQTGMPLSQYVLWRRILKIAKQVVNYEKNISSVCSFYGFTDYSHFSRIFKRIFGTNPTVVFSHCRVLQQALI